MRKIKRVVIKIGTKVIASKDKGLDCLRISRIAEQVSAIRKSGIEVIVVTSGAIGAGMALLDMKKRPVELSQLQASAAIGQNYMMSVYSKFFKEHGYIVGQILLTQEDFNDRARYLNIKHTISELLAHKVIPIVNENDTVATDEIRCGDNDRLSALVADICEADKLIILTDVDGLLDSNKRIIRFVDSINSDILKLGGKSRCDLGTGGMATKIEAARIAARAGIDCVIANGAMNNVLKMIVLDGDSIGTLLKSSFIAKRRRLAYSKPRGTIRVDDGAREALCAKNKSLLASGIVRCDGSFLSGDFVRIVGNDNEEFARGRANYSADEVARIAGLKSSEFKRILGYAGADEIIHRDNMLIL